MPAGFVESTKTWRFCRHAKHVEWGLRFVSASIELNIVEAVGSRVTVLCVGGWRWFG